MTAIHLFLLQFANKHKNIAALGQPGIFLEPFQMNNHILSGSILIFSRMQSLSITH